MLFFGDPHIGKAIELIRKEKGIRQNQLAKWIGVSEGAMSRYESGEHHVPEYRLQLISEYMRCELIDIMEKAFAIYKFNYCRILAAQTGEDIETVIARHDRRAAYESYRAAHKEFIEKWTEFEKQKMEFEFLQKGEGFTILREIVDTEEERLARKQEMPRKKVDKKETGS